MIIASVIDIVKYMSTIVAVIVEAFMAVFYIRFNRVWVLWTVLWALGYGLLEHVFEYSSSRSLTRPVQQQMYLNELYFVFYTCLITNIGI